MRLAFLQPRALTKKGNAQGNTSPLENLPVLSRENALFTRLRVHIPSKSVQSRPQRPRSRVLGQQRPHYTSLVSLVSTKRNSIPGNEMSMIQYACKRGQYMNGPNLKPVEPRENDGKNLQELIWNKKETTWKFTTACATKRQLTPYSSERRENSRMNA